MAALFWKNSIEKSKINKYIGLFIESIFVGNYSIYFYDGQSESSFIVQNSSFAFKSEAKIAFYNEQIFDHSYHANRNSFIDRTTKVAFLGFVLSRLLNWDVLDYPAILICLRP